MAAFFFDSSALVKSYINELGSPWIRTIFAPSAGNDLHILRIAEVEVASALVRRRKTGGISAVDTQSALAQLRLDSATSFIVLDVSNQLLSSAVVMVETHELRAYDAVQLAAAVALQSVRLSSGLSPLTLVSADIDLNTAAQAEGLSIEDPNSHP